MDCGVPWTGETSGTDATVVAAPDAGGHPRFVPSASDAPVEERRLVTALFCDLVGFTPLTERLDSEQVREIQTGYFERMSREIKRFEGTVEKFAGDAVLALWGVPIAHEDDAERAVRCGLSMQSAFRTVAADANSRWGVTLGLRVGVNTGEGVSGKLNAGGREDFAVTGDVINTAARLQTAVDGGGVMVGEETMRLAQRNLRFSERRDLTLKGKAGTVPGYLALGLRERHAERWEARRERSPLLGREREMDVLLQAWDRSRAGDGQMVMLIAEAGVGKSRLIAEAVERLALNDDVREVRGRCLSYEQVVSLWLVTDLLRTIFDVGEQASQSDVQTQVTKNVGMLLSDEDEETRKTAIDVIGELFGLPVGASMVAEAGPQVRRQILVKSLRLVLACLAAQMPVVLLLEDLHWIDRASAEVLTEVLGDVPHLPVLVLVAQRPEWAAPWSEWSWVERVNLRPLGDQDAVSLATAVLGDLTLAAEVRQYVADRAGGNPFFIEELLQALQETGGIARQDGQVRLVSVAAEKLPSSLTEILLARLDRLETQARALSQTASVIGRSFAVELLSRVARRDEQALQKPLAALVQAEIAFPRMGPQAQYVFKHATIRDVAYNTLLQARRQELHAGVARAIAALYPSDEYAEMIAFHFAQTEEHREAAVWLERAGDRAADMYANQAAIDHYEEARRRLKLSGGEASALARVAEKLGGIFRIVAWYDEALEELEDALATYEASGDLEGEARTGAAIGQVHFVRGAREEAIERINTILERRPSHPDSDVTSPGLVALYVALVDPLSNGGKAEEALVAAERASELARALGDDRLMATAEVRRCLALQGTGRLEDARTGLEDALELAEGAGDLESLSQALTSLGDITLAEGKPDGARMFYQRALKVNESRGDVAETAYLLSRLGKAFFVLGDWSQAQIHFERTVDVVQSISFSHLSASLLMDLGDQYLLQGEIDKASRYLEEPFTIAGRSGQEEQIPYLQIPLAAWDLREGHPREALARLESLLATPVFRTIADQRAMQVAAEAYLQVGADSLAEPLVREGLEEATRQGSAVTMPAWLRIDGMLALRRRSREDAESALNGAVSIARAIPFPYQEARALHTYGILAEDSGEFECARERLDCALELFRQLGAEPDATRVEQAAARVSDALRVRGAVS